MLVGLDAVGYPLLAAGTTRVSSSWQTEGILVGASLVFASFGALVAVRRPANPAGWLLLTAATGQALSAFPAAYGRHAQQHPGALPFGREVWVAGGGGWWLLPFFVLPLLVLLFPDGELPSARWRPLLRALLVAAPVSVASIGLAQDHIGNESDAPVNPLHGIVPDPVTSLLILGSLAVLLVGTAAALVSLLRRMRRSRGDLRAQHQWLGVGVALFAASAVIGVFADRTGVSSYLLGFVGFVGCLTVAVLRYRLYDLGRLVSRTVSYALLSALLAGCYLAGVALTTRVLPFSSSFGVAASTLAAAALFQPARRRIQHLVDRRFNRGRYDAERVVERFAARLRGALDVTTVGNELAVVVHGTVQPAALSVWMANPSR